MRQAAKAIGTTRTAMTAADAMSVKARERHASEGLSQDVRRVLLSDPAIRKMTETRSLDLKVKASCADKVVTAATLRDEPVAITKVTARLILALSEGEREDASLRFATLTVIASFDQQAASTTLRAANLPTLKAKALAQASGMAERLKAAGKPGHARILTRQAKAHLGLKGPAARKDGPCTASSPASPDS